MRIGYSLLTEEHSALDLVRYGRRAEELGCDFLGVSDHYHPWVSNQGQSPFVWEVIGGLATVTERVEIATMVTCPTTRIHPAIIAQAAATMLPRRFTFGVGTGEALNEHILGDHWPPAPVRLHQLKEAIEIIRGLWSGQEITHYGEHYTVEEARLYSLPEEPPPILVAASGSTSAALAARNDGIIAVSPDSSLITDFEAEGGTSKRRIGQLTVSWADDEMEARRNARMHWPQSTLGGGVAWEIRKPELFEALVANATEDEAAASMVTTTEAGPIIEAIRQFEDAGFDSVTVHQVGPRQLPFLEFYAAEVLSQLVRTPA